MNENVTVQEILVFIGILVLMIGSLLYGLLVVGAGQVENCWDKYSNNEVEAILNCEGKE
jgi:hypothetical protein